MVLPQRAGGGRGAGGRQLHCPLLRCSTTPAASAGSPLKHILLITLQSGVCSTWSRADANEEDEDQVEKDAAQIEAALTPDVTPQHLGERGLLIFICTSRKPSSIMHLGWKWRKSWGVPVNCHKYFPD